MNFCSGCGVELQNTNSQLAGFTTANDNLLCQRCFRMINYNELPSITIDDNEFIKIIEDIKLEKCLVFIVFDLFDFDTSKLQEIKQYIGNNKIFIIANKKDLLPRLVKDKKIADWIAEKIKINANQVIITSAIKNYHIDNILEIITNNNFEKNYILGTTNTGKTTIVNKIINNKQLEKTTSYYPGTTLGKITIPLKSNQLLIDTPGLINKAQLIHLLDVENYKKIIPRHEVRPRTYQLNKEQTLFITGFCQFNFIDGEKTGFTVYASNEVKIHRTKLAQSEQLRETHLGEDLLIPPTKSELLKIDSFTKHQFEIKQSKTDIVISGLGFICINQLKKSLKIEIITPIGVNVEIRKSII